MTGGEEEEGAREVCESREKYGGDERGKEWQRKKIERKRWRKRERKKKDERRKREEERVKKERGTGVRNV